METYARKADIFRCIQYTGDNRDKIIDALGIPKEACQCWTNADTKANYLVIKGVAPPVLPNWWVMVGGGGIVDIVSPALFSATYQQIVVKE